jgi:hypothetical protein
MRRLTLALSLLALVVPLAACGGATSLEGVASAAEKVEDAKTVRFAFSGAPNSIGGEGAIDLENDRFSLRMQPDEAHGDHVGGAVEIRFVDGAIYMKNPEFASITDKPWVKLEGPTGTVDSPDPAQALDILKSAVDFEEAGRADVRGVPTTHYRGTIGDDTNGITPAGSIVEAWIDEQGYPRKMSFVDGEATATIEFYDFGTDVNIEPPSPDETATEADLGKGDSG